MIGLGTDQWVILVVGAMVAVACALIGTFLVLRKVALLGDAISHAVLPGIAIAFILTGGRSTLPMLIGAGALGVLTVFLVGLFKRTRLLHEDASIGVVFPMLFSIGVILITRYAGQVDLDVDCVLYGEIAYAPLDILTLSGRSFGPRPLWVSGGIALFDLALVVAFYKELKITSFDPELAAALGISPLLIHYLLMSGVSITVVGSFESVGAILVVAMLIVPPATAYLLTNALATMLILASLFGISASMGGYFVARALDASIAGAMASVAGLQFVITLIVSPTQGLLVGALRRRRLAGRFRSQLVLLHLSSTDASDVAALSTRFGWRPEAVSRILGRLERAAFVERVEVTGYRLTVTGSQAITRAGIEVLSHQIR